MRVASRVGRGPGIENGKHLMPLAKCQNMLDRFKRNLQLHHDHRRTADERFRAIDI